MGPIALFDKSFLQSLSTDESVWFDHFFYPVIAPVFFIETLADLTKPARPGKTPEDEVGIIAAKTPEMSGAPCHLHSFLAMQSLLGALVPMNGQIPIAGARPVERDGKYGAVVEVPPEAVALQRWKRGEFLEVERRHARAWRAQLEATDLGALQTAMNGMGINPKTCKSHEDALAMAKQIVAGLTKSTGRFAAMLDVLDVPDAARRVVSERWKRNGRLGLLQFAPYAAHVLTVERYFRVAVGAHKIAATRASNRADVAYLFYLPFCHVFVSGDRLHRVCAPLFLRPDQRFVWGAELKRGLADLNDFYSGLPAEVKAQAIYQFARELPEGRGGLVHDLCAQFAPGALPGKRRDIDTSAVDPEKMAEIVEDIKKWDVAPISSRAAVAPQEDMTSLIIKREIHGQRGSWVQIAPEHRK